MPTKGRTGTALRRSHFLRQTMRDTTNFACRKEQAIRPIPASIAVMIHENQVLLVRRANPPDAGCWGFPGGKVEFGEAIESCAVRELEEETGVIGEAVKILTAVDALDFADDGRLREHFILIAVLCRWSKGAPVAGDDALEARWFMLDQLETAGLALSQDVAEVARQAAIEAGRGVVL